MEDCKILLIGYEGFSRFWPNPSEELVGSLNGERISGCKIEAQTLPVKFSHLKSIDILSQWKEYSAVIGVGLAVNAREPRLEVTAVNLVDYDEGRFGEKRSIESIIDEGPSTLPTGLPYKLIIDNCREKGLPLRPGACPGTYMCNALAYILHYWSWKTSKPAGFIHIPPDTNTSMRTGTGNAIPFWLLKETMKCILETLALSNR